MDPMKNWPYDDGYKGQRTATTISGNDVSGYARAAREERSDAIAAELHDLVVALLTDPRMNDLPAEIVLDRAMDLRNAIQETAHKLAGGR